MALLSDPDRADVTAELQRTPDCPGAITKPQLRAVFDAIDVAWEGGIATTMNTAIPQPQRGILTAKQKAAIFMVYLQKKYLRT